MNNIIMNKKVLNVINENKDINIIVNQDEMVILNYYNDNQNTFNINTKQSNNSYLIVNVASKVKQDIKVNINSSIVGNNNRLVINVRVIGLEQSGIYNVVAKVQEKTQDNEVVEDLKGLIRDSQITLIPILEIDTNEVDASHFATVGSFNSEELFYLKSKGIAENKAKDLLQKNFINSLFNDEFIKLIDERKENNE